jgi:hypothetical protein
MKGELREMKIELNLNTKPIRRRTYIFNSRIKLKVKEEIGYMLETKLIFL